MTGLLQLLEIWLESAAEALIWGGVAALAVSMAVCCVLLIRLPEVADRAIVFDLVMIHLVGLIGLCAIVLRYPLLLDTLIVVAVLGFLGTVAIARYLERSLRLRPRNGAAAQPPEHTNASLEAH